MALPKGKGLCGWRAWEVRQRRSEVKREAVSESTGTMNAKEHSFFKPMGNEEPHRAGKKRVKTTKFAL